jgi:hypothetical protein
MNRSLSSSDESYPQHEDDDDVDVCVDHDAAAAAVERETAGSTKSNEVQGAAAALPPTPSPRAPRKSNSAEKKRSAGRKKPTLFDKYLANGSFPGADGRFRAAAQSSDDYEEDEHLLDPTLQALRSPACGPDDMDSGHPGRFVKRVS